MSITKDKKFLVSFIFNIILTISNVILICMNFRMGSLKDAEINIWKAKVGLIEQSKETVNQENEKLIIFFKTRYDALVKEYANKLNEIQTELNVVTATIEVLKKENGSLTQENIALKKKVDSLLSNPQISIDKTSRQEMQGISSSLDKLTKQNELLSAKILDAQMSLGKIETSVISFKVEQGLEPKKSITQGKSK